MKNTRKARASKRIHVVIGSGSWGLFYGEIDADKATQNEIAATKAVVAYNCRNIRYWYGPTGGITSLAAWGPNPEDKRNRIGAPCPFALLTGVVNVYAVPPEAQARFDAVKPEKI